MVMSDIRRNRINLLNNDCFRTTSALTGIFSVLGKSPTGVTCGRAHANWIGRGRFGVEPLRLARGARVMILPVVDVFKAKGIAAMVCSLLHANTQRATADANISSLMDSRRGFRCVRSMTARTRPGSAAHALPVNRARRARRGVPREQG
jgi:hypothetical protein